MNLYVKLHPRTCISAKIFRWLHTRITAVARSAHFCERGGTKRHRVSYVWAIWTEKYLGTWKINSFPLMSCFLDNSLMSKLWQRWYNPSLLMAPLCQWKLSILLSCFLDQVSNLGYIGLGALWWLEIRTDWFNLELSVYFIYINQVVVASYLRHVCALLGQAFWCKTQNIGTNLRNAKTRRQSFANFWLSFSLVCFCLSFLWVSFSAYVFLNRQVAQYCLLDHCNWSGTWWILPRA